MIISKKAGFAAVLVGLALAAAPACAEAASVQADGVMGQSLTDETVYDTEDILQMRTDAFSMPALLRATASSEFTDEFLSQSFTTDGEYTDATYYHRADYENFQLFNGIDVSWWQGGGKGSSTTNLDWESVHDAGIDFAFVRVGSRDTEDGSIYEDTCADAHITAAQENDINIGLYIFSQALDEDEAIEEAEFVLDKLDAYGWDVTLPIVIDREKGSYGRLKAGTLSKDEETAVIQAFADTIVDAGYQACVYASYSWINNYILMDELYDCGLWIARYNNTTTSNSKEGTPYADLAYDYEYWQYSSSATVDGYSGRLDVDFWYLDTEVQTTGLSVTDTTLDGVSLKWSAADNVTGYRIYRYDEDTEKYTALKTQTGRTYTDEEVFPGETYQYKVRCYWEVGGTKYFGTYSSVVTATVPPETVTELTTDTRNSTSLVLSWEETDGADGYRVYGYNEDSESFEKLADVTDGSCTYKATGLSSAKEYRFKVKAYTETDSEKVWGSASTAYADCTKPAKVENFTVECGGKDSLILTWSKVSRASGYQIYRLDTETDSYVKIATITSAKTVTYTDEGLSSAKGYTYKVRAYKSYQEETIKGSCADPVKMVTKPAKVKNLTVTAKSSAAALTWDKVARASGYQIYRLNTETGKYEKIATVKGAATVSYKDKNLTKGKTYTYKVRAYKSYDGTNYCGSCSATSSVKIKKA